MALNTDQLNDALGRGGDVIGSDDKIGSIGQVYIDNDTGQPEWVTTKTGLFGTSESFVPLHGADLDGDNIVVAFDKATVKDAPRVDADGELTPADEERLYAYYGLTGNGTGTGNGTRGETSDESSDQDGVVGHDTSGPSTDDAMTRSEEQLRVGTQTQEAGRARLRKYVVTEQVTQTIPVQREEVRIEREPITDANYDSSQAGPDISEEEHEVILHEERPVVEKEAVAVERVKLGTETVTDDVAVTEEVRKEQIDTSGTEPADPDRNR